MIDLVNLVGGAGFKVSRPLANMFQIAKGRFSKKVQVGRKSLERLKLEIAFVVGYLSAIEDK